MPNLDHFLAAASIASIGILALVSVLPLVDRKLSAEQDVAGVRYNDRIVRAVFLAYGLIGLWIGVRLSQAVMNPDRWFQLAEMGWMYLISSALGSLASLRRSWRSKWMLGIAIVGLSAMFYATVV